MGDVGVGGNEVALRWQATFDRRRISSVRG